MSKKKPNKQPSNERADNYDDTMHFACSSDKKSEAIEYCERNDITLSQFGRWAMNYFMTAFPDRPPVGGVE